MCCTALACMVLELKLRFFYLFFMENMSIHVDVSHAYIFFIGS
jgi:hypothetical protein